jgi:hypothetical protein
MTNSPRLCSRIYLGHISYSILRNGTQQVFIEPWELRPQSDQAESAPPRPAELCVSRRSPNKYLLLLPCLRRVWFTRFARIFSDADHCSRRGWLLTNRSNATVECLERAYSCVEVWVFSASTLHHFRPLELQFTRFSV